MPEWDELNDDEKSVAESFIVASDKMDNFEPHRVILMQAFLTDRLVGTLADRVLAARSMGAGEMLDPRTNVCGMALATAMSAYREAYEICFDPAALAAIAEEIEGPMKLVDELHADMSPENMERVIAALQKMRLED